MMMNKRPIKDLKAGRSWLLDYLDQRTAAEVPRVIKENRFTDLIFRSCVHDDPEFQKYITSSKDSFPSLPELALDVFTALFSKAAEFNSKATMTDRADACNLPILDRLLNEPDYPQLAKLCQGKELPAYRACTTFCRSLTEQLKQEFPNEYQYLSIIELLNEQVSKLIKELTYEYLGMVTQNQKLTLQQINRLKNKLDQIENLQKKLDEGIPRYAVRVGNIVGTAMEQAMEEAKATTYMLLSWGSDAGNMQNIPQNRELLDHIKNSTMLSEIAITLGRYREMMLNKKKSSHTYGLGEKYDLTTGNDLNACLASQFGLLGSPETQVLFARKWSKKGLVQHRKRMPVSMGKGDMIVLLDESSSTRSVQSWGKAVAFALLDIASKGHRRFALVHFAGADSIKTDIFDPGKYTTADVMESAEHFFAGGTDFESPMNEALRLIDSGFENADVTMITDGECTISDSFAVKFSDKKQLRGVTLTGILLKADQGCGESLLPFCDKVYRTCDIAKDDIAINLLERKM